MAEVVQIDNPADYPRVEKRIRKLWEEGSVEFTPHAQGRMEERGVDANDVQHLVRYGRVVEHSLSGLFWRYKIEGKTIDATRLSVVVEINGRLIVVTVVTGR